jgi:molybdenum cofactor cytidylyltransferase
VIAAGELPEGGMPLLGQVLTDARACGFDQLVVALGRDSGRIGTQVNLTGADVIVNCDDGCSSPIAAAVRAVDPRCDVLVLMLGDQPGVRPQTVSALLAGRRGAPIAVCRYEDGPGHPLAFGASLFPDLSGLHGDRAVWKLLDRHAHDAAEVPIAGPVPRDVDTEDDYRAVFAAAAGT